VNVEQGIVKFGNGSQIDYIGRKSLQGNRCPGTSIGGGVQVIIQTRAGIKQKPVVEQQGPLHPTCMAIHRSSKLLPVKQFGFYLVHVYFYFISAFGFLIFGNIPHGYHPGKINRIFSGKGYGIGTGAQGVANNELRSGCTHKGKSRKHAVDAGLIRQRIEIHNDGIVQCGIKIEGKYSRFNIRYTIVFREFE